MTVAGGLNNLGQIKEALIILVRLRKKTVNKNIEI